MTSRLRWLTWLKISSSLLRLKKPIKSCKILRLSALQWTPDESLEHPPFHWYGMSFTTKKRYFGTEHNPLFDELWTNYYRVIVDSPYRPDLADLLPETFFMLAENRLQNLFIWCHSLFPKENELVDQYNNLMATAQLDFRGQTYNLSQMGLFNQSIDPLPAKKALKPWPAFWKAWNWALIASMTNWSKPGMKLRPLWDSGLRRIRLQDDEPLQLQPRHGQGLPWRNSKACSPYPCKTPPTPSQTHGVLT